MSPKREAKASSSLSDGAGMEQLNSPGSSDAGEPDFPSKETVPYLIATISRLLAAGYLDDMKGKGITSAQTFVLRELMRCSPQTQVGIARNMGLSKVSIGETLNRLEAAGMITRERSSTDRRSIAISLTPKARALKRSLVAKSYKQLEMVENILGTEQNGQVTKALLVLEEGLRTQLGKVRPKFE